MLGSLLEKQVTVPATYPLSLNALRTACNQASSRDPVVAYDDAEVSATVARLKGRGLVRIVWADHGPRTLKHHQLLTDVIELDDAERALLTVLLLRGDQAPGELRSRTERLHPFADRDQVEQVLAALAERGLVAQLDRRPGQQDRRWRHLLGTPGDDVPAPTDTRPSSESVLADGRRDARVVTSYDAVAETYADRLGDELDGKPFDRWLLDRVVADAGGDPVLDVGCGPGHITAYLVAAGARARGTRPVRGDGAGGAGASPGAGCRRRRPPRAAPPGRRGRLGRDRGALRAGARGDQRARRGRGWDGADTPPGRAAAARGARRR